MKTKKYFVLLITFILSLNFINSTYADWTNPSNAADVIAALWAVNDYRNAHWNTYTTWNTAANLIVNLNTNTVTVTCDNWAVSAEVTLPASDITNLEWLGYDVVVIPPVAPQPVYTSSSSTSGWCWSYISSWSTLWSNCTIEWTWLTNWTISCRQTPSFSANTSSCWSQTCTTSYTDWVATGTSCWACSWCPWDAAQPNIPDDIKTINLGLNNPSSTCSWKFANNNDSCSVIISVSWNTNQDKSVVNWWSNWTITNILDTSNEPSDRINWLGKALNFSNISNTWPIDWKWAYYINWIKSRSPFSTNIWKISLNVWWVDMILSNISYSFNKPLIWYIQASIDNWSSWNALPSLGTLLKYKLSYDNIGSIVISNYFIENFASKIFPISNYLEIQNKSISTSTLNTNWTIFSSRINTSSDVIDVLPVAWLQVEKPAISYNLWWEIIKYFLSKNELPDDISPLKITWEQFLWVKIIWILQWDWKQSITWQQSNFSDIYPFNLKTNIRKSAFKYISSMKSWEISNWVKYIEWEDITISWVQNYETLVVKNWNVIINWDLNKTWKKLWIIVLKDSYDSNIDYNTSWNIYIDSNVTYVNSLFYADWWVISSKNSNPYIEDSTTRSYELNKQLTIKWTLVTRNTIWWAILSWGDYLLPWNSKTADFDKAMIYDLNYLRRWNDWCDKNWNLNCNDNGEYREPVVIIFDSNLSNNPPKLFEN